VTYIPCVRSSDVDRETFDAAYERATTQWPGCPATGWFAGLHALIVWPDSPTEGEPTE
jgi:hypothetical protein